MLNGVLYVDKPAGITSHDVVSIVRRATRTRRVGHAGTLDPFASGLVVVAVGSCTRLLPYFDGEPKVYEAVIAFGGETDTDDSTGAITREAEAPSWTQPDVRASLDRATASLTGRIAQVPPSYSAKHVNGQRAYSMARRGERPLLQPVNVTVHAWSIEQVSGNEVRARITCAGGTYVRALARDLGRAMRSAAHCRTLRRERSGPADVREAMSPSALHTGAVVDTPALLRSPLELLHNVSHQYVDADELRGLAHGRSVAATTEGDTAALIARNDVTGVATVVGIGVRTIHNRWQPNVVLLGDAS